MSDHDGDHDGDHDPDAGLDVTAEEAAFCAAIARPLQAPERLGPDFEGRLLAAVRAAAAAPVAVGFGIRSAASARQFSAIADGVVVGSALVDAVAAGPVDTAHERVATLVRELAGAMPR